jgi:hypothetical protein
MVGGETPALPARTAEEGRASPSSHSPFSSRCSKYCKAFSCADLFWLIIASIGYVVYVNIAIKSANIAVLSPFLAYLSSQKQGYRG